MAGYKAFLEGNDAAIANYLRAAPEYVEGCLVKQAKLKGSGQTEDADWAAYDAAKGDLIEALVGVQLSIVRKVPTKQPEDTFGAEVQESVAGVVTKALGALRGGGEKDSSAKYTGYLAAKAGLFKDKKDRPDGYPADLDAAQLSAFERVSARGLADAYNHLIHATVEVKTLLETNKELLDKPKRTFSNMM